MTNFKLCQCLLIALLFLQTIKEEDQQIRNSIDDDEYHPDRWTEADRKLITPCQGLLMVMFWLEDSLVKYSNLLDKYRKAELKFVKANDILQQLRKLFTDKR